MKTTAVIGLVALALVACRSDRTAADREALPPRGGPPLVSGTAEVVGDVPLTVSLAGVEPTRPDQPAVLLLTLETSVDSTVMIDDLRWMFSVDGGSGLLAVTGTGCAPEFSGPDEVGLSCGDEPRAVEVRPDSPRVEEIRVHRPPVGLPVAEGVFTFTQPIAWALVDAESSHGAPAGNAAVLLSVEVTRPGV